MFTGLIEGTGTLLRIDRHGPDAKMVIQAGFDAGKFVLGESISVDGACLTITAFSGAVFTADVSAETLSRATLGHKPVGSRLNLERALKFGDRLGGHLVSGHVDGIAIFREQRPEGRSLRLYFDAPPEIMRYVIEKGSVAINGVSLTVNGVREDGFDVNIIPHTASRTTVGDLRPGDQVNIETDLLGKYVEKMIRAWGAAAEKGKSESRIDIDFLKEHGFT
ncbi:MAG: riboflavin synthase [Syntrophobacter sp.]